jgi:hypothetical protein
MGSRVFTRWHRLFRTAGVVCALVAGALALPETARASCGDYVTVTTSPEGTGGHPQPSSPRHDPDQHPKPCSGPSCSGEPLPSPPPPESSGNAHGERWADLAGSVQPADSSSALFAPAERLTDLSRRLSDVYHPPR